MRHKPLLVLFTGNTVPAVMERHGDFDAHFRRAIGDAWDGPWQTRDARTDDFAWPDAEEVAGVVVTGSSSSVTERAPWMLRLEEHLRDAVAREVPLLGVCFGHQILAQALGGTVLRNPQGRHIGTRTVRRLVSSGTQPVAAGTAPLVDDPLLDGIPAEFAVNLSHQDHVAIAPKGIRTLVTADHDPTHAFAAGRFARAVQFHPEFHDEIVKGYVEARRDILTSEGLDPDALYAAASDAPHARCVLRNFVRHFVKKG